MPMLGAQKHPPHNLRGGCRITHYKKIISLYRRSKFTSKAHTLPTEGAQEAKASSVGSERIFEWSSQINNLLAKERCSRFSGCTLITTSNSCFLNFFLALNR
jgi:hypothetical protein